jgi:hypothetical protein
MVSDKLLGRLERMDMYALFTSSKLAISIPYSDSSPKTVYEAIFCGCAVAIVYHPYYDDLPECIKSRIILVDINDNAWFDKAVRKSEEIIKIPFVASQEAIEMFDKYISCLKIRDILFS